MSERFFYDDFACNLLTSTDDLSTNATMIENCGYAEKLNEVQHQEGMLKDTEQLYIKVWMQITNILAGCFVLAILMYLHTT